MVDVLTAAQRRLNMSRIRGKDTKPEMLIRRGLHQLGLRYRLHRKDLPGRPDMAFSGKRVVIFINGCFWHGHDCALFKLPETRTDFWKDKIAKNIARDQQALDQLQVLNWRVLTIWECALRGRRKLPIDKVISRCERFIAVDATACHEITSLSPESCD